MIKLYAYVASPVIFSPNAHEAYQKLRTQLEERLGIILLTPADEDHSDPEDIFLANLALIDKADIVLVDCSPFRGPSADAGVCVEVGYAYAKGKPCFAYNMEVLPYCYRVDTPDPSMKVDRNGWNIEDFDLFDNLMIAKAMTPYHMLEPTLKMIRLLRSSLS